VNIKNYTSSSPVLNSVTNIEKVLVDAGAKNITKSYDNGMPTGFVFQIAVQDILMTIKLPSNVPAVERVLLARVKKPTKDTRSRVHDQAMRTAWRFLYDWVACQVTAIALDQVEAMQVFLPYAYNPQTDQTYYEQLRAGGFKQLTAGTEIR
jgi:hypothetical protein